MSINRRYFNKLLSIAPLSGIILGTQKLLAGNIETNEIEYIPNVDLINKEIFENSEFSRLFQVLDCTKETGLLEFPLDFHTSPNTAPIAYTKSKISTWYEYERNIGGDYIVVSTFDVNYNYENKSDNELIKLINEDLSNQCWGLVRSAAFDRNIIISDGDSKEFSKRLISLMKTLMRRNGGNNSVTVDRGRLTDLYINPAHIQTIKNWIPQEDSDKWKIERNKDETIVTVFGVNIHASDFLSKDEVFGFDLRVRDNLVFPIKSFFKINKEKSEVSAEIGIAILSIKELLAGRIN